MKHVNRALIPNVGLGPIHFGVSPEQLVEEGYLEFVEGDPDFTDDDHYRDRTNEIRVHVDENGLIDLLTCDGELWFRDRNLIGLTPLQADDVFGQSPDDTDTIDMPDESIQQTRDYDRFGVMLWFLDGRCVTVSIDQDEPED